MPKRGENIYRRRDGRWEGRYIKGRKSDGTASYGSVYGRSYNEVKKRLMPLKALHYESYPEARCTRPFGDYLLARLEAQRTGRIKPASYDAYYRIVHNHILPALGDIPVHQLSPQHMQQFLLDMHRNGLGDGTIRNIYRYLSSATKLAAKTGVLLLDVCEDIVLPKPKLKTVHALSRSEQQRLETAAIAELRESNAASGLEVILALYTGMRVGELCALRWEDIDFDSQMIQVNHTMQRLNLHGQEEKTVVTLGSPKSESSIRKIPISSQLTALLRDIRRKTQGDFVLRSRQTYAEPRVIQYRFEKLLQRAQLPRVGFHTLRHSFATRCMELNIDVATISKLLGHSSVKLTLDIYTDSLMEHRRAAITKLDELQFDNLFGSIPSQNPPPHP